MSNNLLPCLMSNAGLVSACCAAFIGLLNVYTVLRNPYFRNLYDYQLFFYRFLADFNITAFSSLFYLLLTVSIHDGADETLATIEFYLGLIISVSATFRVFVSFLISVERTVAVYMPAIFFRLRGQIPKILLPAVAAFFAILDIFILYVVCTFEFVPNLKCIMFTCQINKCFLKYYAMNRTVRMVLEAFRNQTWKFQIMYGLTGAFYIALTAKLFAMGCSGKSNGELISRVNKLALIDAAIVLFFDFSSSFVAARGYFAFQEVGPYDTVPKMVGRAIEAYIVSNQLKRAMGIQPIRKGTGRSKHETTQHHVILT